MKSIKQKVLSKYPQAYSFDVYNVYNDNGDNIWMSSIKGRTIFNVIKFTLLERIYLACITRLGYGREFRL